MRRMRRLAAIFAILLVSVFVLSACKGCGRDEDNSLEYEYTPLGYGVRTAAVENPTNDVEITILSKGQIADEGIGSLTYNKSYIANSEEYLFQKSAFSNSRTGQTQPDTGHTVNPGDIIQITADYQYIKIQMLDLPETILYSPTGEYVFQIPSAGGTPNQQPRWQLPYPATSFNQSQNTITASIPTVEEITAAGRTLSENPYDYLYVNEINVTTTTDTAPDGSLPKDSVSVENGEVLAFPHAYANRITTGGNRQSFLPRNAIDGDKRTANNGHINYGAQSWGGGRKPDSDNGGVTWTAANNYGYYDDLTYVVYFGREVTLTELGIVTRADVSGSPAHDINYTGMTAEFSDGSTQELTGFELLETEQKRSITPVKTTYVRLKDFTRNFSDINAGKLGNWTALTEFSAYGKEELPTVPGKKKKDPAIPVIPTAVKTYTINTFGQRETVSTTDQLKAADVKAMIDFAGKDAMEVVRTRIMETDPTHSRYVTQPTNLWVDSVLYSGLLDAHGTTGTREHYEYLRYVSDKYKYSITKNAGGTDRGAQSLSVADVIAGDENYTGIGDVMDFADDYLMGEAYLQMNDMKPAKYKTYNSVVNADANMKHKPSWNPRFNKASTTFNPGNTSDQNPRPASLADNDVFDWWWCDAIYMGMNYFTYMSNMTGDAQYVKKAYNSYQYWKGILACDDEHYAYENGSNAEKRVNHGTAGHGDDWALWHRDTDNTNFRVNGNGKSLPTFWARGNAWVVAALAKQMLYLDETKYPDIYATYKADLIAMAKTLLYYQREDGTWNVSINDPDWYPGRESTGTSGFLYGFAIGVQLGILPADQYMPAIIKGYKELTQNMRLYNVTNPDQIRLYGDAGVRDGRLGYMQSVGYRSSDYENEMKVELRSNPFGYGLFLHAASAIMRLCSDYERAEFQVPADAQYGVAKVPEYKGVKD